MNNIFDFHSFKRALKYIRPYSWVFLFTIFSSILFSFLSAGRPILIQLVFDKYIDTSFEPTDGYSRFLIDNINWSFSSFMLLIIGFLLIESLLQFFFIFKSNYIAQLIIKDVRLDLFDKILRFKVSYFDKTPTGKILTRVISDIEAIGNMFSQGVLVVFGDIFKILIIVFWMFFSNWKLALIALSFFPLLIFSTAIFQRLMKKTFENIRHSISILNVFVYEHITGMHMVKMFNQENNESKKFKKINKIYTDFNIESVLYFSIFLPIIDIFSAISMGLIVWFGGNILFTELGQENPIFNISIGQIISFILLINMLFRPLRAMADKFNTLQMGIVASTRVFQLIDLNSQLERNVGIKHNDIYTKDIVFKNVSFSYNNNEVIFNDLNLNIESGKTLAIVGPTGSGKTTLINLLTRFYKVNNGKILISNNNINDLNLNILRENIGLILQDSFLFSDTIFNNINFFSNKNENEILSILKKIQLLEFVQSFPEGLNYQVGEGGVFLSLGQRQLISFIRTYVSEPSIIIFDEATSSLDSHTERLIKRSIKFLIKNKTAIIIAHRLSTIKNADKIIFLKDGKIIEQGTHNQLISLNGLYAKYCKTQLV